MENNMAEHTLHPELEKVRDLLDLLAQEILSSHTENRNMVDVYGWNYPALNRHELSRAASELASTLESRGTERRVFESMTSGTV
jgi:uncharacterized membrane-anchored protein YhcB (DUF1043 family)